MESTNRGEWTQWKEQVNRKASEDLHDLATRLGLKVGKGEKGANRLYHAPHRTDTKPSLSIFTRSDGMGWKDHTSGSTGGDAISLYQYVRNVEFTQAVNDLAEIFNIPQLTPNNPKPVREKSQVEYIAERCLAGNLNNARRYLAGRGITESIIESAIKKKVLGWNNWVSKEKPIGSIGYGGEGVAFVIRDHLDRRVLAVDVRYETPDHNGGVKSNSQGAKDGAPFVLDWARFNAAKTVVVVESAINALSVLSCEIPSWDAMAVRGIGAIKSLPLDSFHNKFVVIAFDYDAVNKEGKRPGPEAAQALYGLLCGAGIPAIMLDQLEWEEGWDINDILQKEKVAGLKQRLQHWESCAIPGMIGGEKRYPGKPRIYLPADDYQRYWRYKVATDLTKYVDKVHEDEETGKQYLDIVDVAGFRVADISRVNIQPWDDTVHGTRNGSGDVLFAVQAQTPQHGRRLKRTVMDDKQFADPAAWGQLGYIYQKPEFMRLVNILSRTLDNTDRLAVNYVGLCYKAGKLVVNEGQDCYFKDVLKQCPAYGHLRFNHGNQQQGREVLAAFQATFNNNAGSLALVWALGAHLKAHLGFYPHMQMEAEKGSGKSTFLMHWSKATQTQVFSTQMLDTAFRIQSIVAYSGQPVAWEEISTLRPEAAQAANQMLQQTYNYAYSVRGGTTPMLYSTPVLLTGEEVDMNSLLGKLTRTSLSHAKQGKEIRAGLPVFPMKPWLQWLSEREPEQVQQDLEKQFQQCLLEGRAKKEDANAKRIVKNFACIRLAWHYLCEFLNVDTFTGGFERDLVTEMNNFLAETEASRQPWVWIVEIIFAEIDARNYKFPIAYDSHEGKNILLIRHKHMMQHIQHSTHLRQRWDALPIKTPKVFLNQMLAAEAVITDNGKPIERERSIGRERIGHMLMLDLEKLEQFGLVLTRDHLQDV